MQRRVFVAPPAGKVEKGEDKFDAVLRELFEETGIERDKEDLRFRGTYHFRGSTGDLRYHSFIYKPAKKPKVKIDKKAHKKYTWASLENALKLDLIHDVDFLFGDL